MGSAVRTISFAISRRVSALQSAALGTRPSGTSRGDRTTAFPWVEQNHLTLSPNNISPIHPMTKVWGEGWLLRAILFPPCHWHGVDHLICRVTLRALQSLAHPVSAQPMASHGGYRMDLQGSLGWRAWLLRCRRGAPAAGTLPAPGMLLGSTWTGRLHV